MVLQKIRLNQKSSREEINFVAAVLKIRQEDLAKEFDVTQGAISRAIANDPLLKSLREKIIGFLNTLQRKSAKRTGKI